MGLYYGPFIIFLKMLIKRYNYVWRKVLLIIMVLCAGCSLQESSNMNSTAMVVDDGVLRIWRKDINQQPSTIIMAFSPYSGNSQLVRFNFIHGSLSQIVTTIESQPQVIEQLHFDDNGNVTFNQRQLKDRREQLSEEYIQLAKYVTEQTVILSRALISQRIKLYQGQYNNGIVTNCEGVRIRLSLDDTQKKWLSTRNKNRKKQGLAWITTPYGTQLLLIADEDFCVWQPTYEQM